MRLEDGTELRETRVIAGDVALRTMEAGPAGGPPVVLLHGFPEFWWGWRRQIGPLARAGFRVVVPDQRGYGASDKPGGIGAYRLDRLGRDVLALADALGIGRFALAGHDWGGIVAWRVAADAPDRVSRLAILNAPHPDTARGTILRDPVQLMRSFYVGLFQLPGLPETLLAARDYAALRHALASTSRAGTFSEADLDRYRDEAWAVPGALTASLNWYRALVRRPTSATGRIAVPTLILWGRRDTALGPTFVEESLKLCEDARAVWFDEATHWLQHEKAEAVNRELVGFFG